MAGSYELWLTDDYGRRLANCDGETLLDRVVDMQASRVVNDVGSLFLRVPATFDQSLIAVDNMVQVWRAPAGATLQLWRPYFIRKWRFEMHGSEEHILIWGRDPVDLLARRIIAAYAGSTQADKTDFADDMMKEIATELESDLIPPIPTAGSRAWADLYIQAQVAAGPTITQAFAWQYILPLMQRLSSAAKEAGTEVFFDIVPRVISSAAIDFEFRTYVGQPGMDRTITGTLFDQEKGNMRDPYLEYDYTEEENYIYAGGKGQETEREIQQVYDAARYSASQWNRREGFANAVNQDLPNGVREVGRARLFDERPRIRFGAAPLDVAGTRFGVDWEHGDKVRARYRGIEFDCIIRATVISLDEDGKETIGARLEFEG